MCTDVMPGVLHASSPADDPVEAAPVPTLPTQDVLPKAVPVALSLMKPASPFAQAMAGSSGYGHASEGREVAPRIRAGRSRSHQGKAIGS